jgi:hypothetical protein
MDNVHDFNSCKGNMHSTKTSASHQHTPHRKNKLFFRIKIKY